MHCQNEVWWELPAAIDRRPVRLDKVLGHGKADFEDPGNGARHVLIANELCLGSTQVWMRDQTKCYQRVPRLVFFCSWQQRIRWIVDSAYPAEVEVTKVLGSVAVRTNVPTWSGLDESMGPDRALMCFWIVERSILNLDLLALANRRVDSRERPVLDKGGVLLGRDELDARA
jgi:hypothetical protein